MSDLNSQFIKWQEQTALAMLTEQEEASIHALDVHVDNQVKVIHMEAERTKRALVTNLEAEICQRERLLNHEYERQVAALERTILLQKGNVERQALEMTFNYRRTVAEEEIEKQWHK